MWIPVNTRAAAFWINCYSFSYSANFSINLGEDAPNLGDIMEEKKDCLTNLIYMLFKYDLQFLTVILEVNIKSANLFFRCLGSKTVSSVLSELKHKKIVDIQV